MPDNHWPRALIVPNLRILSQKISLNEGHYLPLPRDLLARRRNDGPAGYHRHGWPLNPKSTFPSVRSCTRNEKVAIHPLRAFKPQPSEVLYRRWCSAVSQMLEIAYFDLEGVHHGTEPVAIWSRSTSGTMMSAGAWRRTGNMSSSSSQTYSLACSVGTEN